MILNSPYISGSLTVTGNIITSGSITISGSIASSSYALTASNALTLQGLGSASFAPASTFNTVSQSYAASSASLSTRVTTNETNISTLTAASASFAVASGSISGRVTLIEGQYATTGSNTFTGPQYVNQASNAISFTSTASLYTDGGLRVAKDSFVSGTAYFNNITVYGTSSIEYITSSQVNIGSNIITVNTDTPAVRFGGLSVFDSGSTQLTGSIFWDSEKNNWIYSNPSGSSYNSAMLMNGPRNTGSLGDEQGTTNNALMKGQGGDHITSSLITETGTATTFYTNALYVTASGNVAVGLTSSAWNTFSSLQVQNAAIWSTADNNSHWSSNLYYNGSDRIYISSNYATEYAQQSGVHKWFYSPSGTAGGVVTVTEAMRISAAGLVGINTTSPSYLLDVSGSGRFTSNFTVFSPTTGATSGDLLVDTSTKYVYVGRLSGVSGDNTTFQVRDRLGTARATLPGGGSIDTVFSLNASNFIVTNYSSNALMTIANSGAATFSSSVGATNFSATQSPSNSVLSTIQLTTASGTLYSTNLQLNTSGGLDTWTYNATNGWQNRITLTTSGNVGIGTSSPTNKLTVYSGLNTSALRVSSDTDTLAVGDFTEILMTMRSFNDYPASFRLIAKNGTGGYIQPRLGIFLVPDNDSTYASMVERMTITSSGNVGIGTSSPLAPFVVSNAGGIGMETLVTVLPDSSAGSYIQTYNRATSAFVTMGFNASQYRWFNSNSEVMRITSTGVMYVTSASDECKIGLLNTKTGGKNWYFNSYSNGNLYLQIDAANLGNFNGSSGTYTAMSDINKKKDFELSTMGLDAILGLEPTLYRMKTDSEDSEKHLGFIAQEVKEFIPQAYVETGDNENKFIGLDYQAITATLVKAIQELKAELDQAKARIETLEK